MKLLRIADICCGIGGMRLAANIAGQTCNIKIDCVFSCDKDKFARKTYFENFNEYPKGDLLKIDSNAIPNHDLLLSGFPCQPFSCAGKKLGLKDDRTDVFRVIVNVLKLKAPAFFLLENVAGLKGFNKGNDFEYILKNLREADYECRYKIINSINYIPQNRKRIYIAGVHKSISGYKKITGKIFNKKPGKNIIHGFDQTFYKQERKFHFKKYENYCYTLTASMVNSGTVPIIKQGNLYRKLTPKECAVNFMGFPRDYIFPVSDTQSYRQIGNSIVIPVVEDIIKNMINKF